MAEFPGPLVPARPAATVLALRSAPRGFEVLMVRRAIGSEFMGNAHVFPGGSVDEGDRSETATAAVRWEGDPEELPWRAAALRELHEEAGLALTEPEGLALPSNPPDLFRAVLDRGARFDAGRLLWISNWITPEGLPKRFDTRFFLAEIGDGESAAADGVEVFDDVWVSPAEALDRGGSGSWDVPFPTQVHLEMLAGHDSIRSVVDYAASIGEVEPVLPRVVLDENGSYEVLVPGQPGYDAGVGR